MFMIMGDDLHLFSLFLAPFNWSVLHSWQLDNPSIPLVLSTHSQMVKAGCHTNWPPAGLPNLGWEGRLALLSEPGWRHNGPSRTGRGGTLAYVVAPPAPTTTTTTTTTTTSYPPAGDSCGGRAEGLQGHARGRQGHRGQPIGTTGTVLVHSNLARQVIWFPNQYWGQSL